MLKHVAFFDLIVASSFPSTAHSHSHAPSRKRNLFPSKMSAVLLISLLSLSLFIKTATAQASQNKILTLNFHDSSNAVVGTPQNIVKEACVRLDFSSLVIQPQPDPADPNAELPPPTQISYVSVSVSEPQAALNLYTDKYCQLLASAAVGLWNNTALTANITSLRWEGTAPASMTPGTLSPNQFPPGVKAQPKTKGPKIEDKWVMDPSKGRIVVGLVAAVMAVGVAIGVYQVYKAAQYVPPPKKYSAVSAGAVGVRKVKRQDAYFKKPVREPMVSAPSTPNMSGLGTANSSPRVSRFEASSRSPLSNHSGQLRHERIPTLAPIASSGGQMDWGTGRRMNGSNQSAGTDAVLIDMQETATFRRPWISGGNGYGQGGSSTGGSSSSAGGMTDLMQFTQDSPTHSVYQSASSTQLSSAYSRGQAHQQTPLAARGGADVLVPMHQLEPRSSPPRSSPPRSR